MLPSITTPSNFRKYLARFLDVASNQLVVIKDRGSNKVLMDEKEYNRLSALANQFSIEDPEGKYRSAFVKEMLKRSAHQDIDRSVKSLSDLI